MVHTLNGNLICGQIKLGEQGQRQDQDNPTAVKSLSQHLEA